MTDLVEIPSAPRSIQDIRDMRRSRRIARASGFDRDSLFAKFPEHSRYETNPKTGRREWVVDVPTHTPNGERTQAGKELQEMATPYFRAETERGRAMSARQPKELVRDLNGGLVGVHPALAESTCNRHGWSAVSRARGAPVERGPDGMLFRWAAGWMPLGVRCLGTPLEGAAEIPCVGIQRDPDGWPWRGLDDGEWIRAEAD